MPAGLSNLKPCRVEGVNDELLCGKLTVFENREMRVPLLLAGAQSNRVLQLTLRKRSLRASRRYTASRVLMNRNLLRRTLQHIFS